MTDLTCHIPVLETDRLRLRAPALADLPAVIDFFASPQSHGVGGPRDDLGAALSLNATLGHWGFHGFGMWHIADRATDQYLGRAGFIMAPGWEAPELGWAVTAQAQGRSIAYEATLAARAHGATQLNLDRVISYIRPANTRSAALAKRLGATLEKTHDNWRGAPCHVFRHPQEAA